MTQENVLSGGAGGLPVRGRLPRARRLAAVASVGALALLAAGCGEQSGDQETPAKAVLSGGEATTGPDAEIVPAPSGGPTPSGGQPWDQAATEACASAVGQGLTQVAQSADDHGVTTFWASGRRWMVCDVAGDAEPALIGPSRGNTGFDERALALTATDLGSGGVRYVAAGRLPWPVDEIAYTLPGETVASARFVTSDGDPEVGWWVVAHTPADGPLAEPGAAEQDLSPVTITVTGGAAEAFRVPWEDLQRSE